MQLVHQAVTLEDDVSDKEEGRKSRPWWCLRLLRLVLRWNWCCGGLWGLPSCLSVQFYNSIQGILVLTSIPSTVVYCIVCCLWASQSVLSLSTAAPVATGLRLAAAVPPRISLPPGLISHMGLSTCYLWLPERTQTSRKIVTLAWSYYKTCCSVLPLLFYLSNGSSPP